MPPSFTFQHSSTANLETEGNLNQRQVECLNRIRKADPQRQTIERAAFNNPQSERRDGQNPCADALHARPDDARAFPGQDLTIHAYAPSYPSRKIATARLNARTRDVTYTPER